MGLQKRTVACQSHDGRILPETSCEIFTRPRDTGMCNNGPCSKSRHWQVGPWSSVSQSPYNPSHRYRHYRNMYNRRRGKRSAHRTRHHKSRSRKRRQKSNNPGWIRGWILWFLGLRKKNVSLLISKHGGFLCKTNKICLDVEIFSLSSPPIPVWVAWILVFPYFGDKRMKLTEREMDLPEFSSQQMKVTIATGVGYL